MQIDRYGLKCSDGTFRARDLFQPGHWEFGDVLPAIPLSMHLVNRLPASALLTLVSKAEEDEGSLEYPSDPSDRSKLSEAPLYTWP